MENGLKKIYLDYAATTSVDKEVLDAMLPYFSEKFGNPMSVHSFGQETLEAIDKSREGVAEFLGCSSGEIVFTSGSTESNNLAIKGSVKSFFADPSNKGKVPHIITTSFEHHCIMDACKSLEKEGIAEVTFLPVSRDGVLDVEVLEKEIKENTILISVMYVNNEIGTLQPIKEISEIIKRKNSDRGEKKIFLHTDATQAINYLDCNVESLGVDLLSLSAHKIYGPKGTGALYVRKGTHIKRIQDGGDQEYKLRGGTHNLTGIVGLGKAIELIKTRKEKNKEIKELSDYIVGRVLKEIPKSYVNGNLDKKSPAITNFRFDDVEGEGLLLSLDLEGIAASTGSACSSGALDPSHVLLALGLKHEEAHGSLRVSIGQYTTREELDIFIEKLKETVERLRSISGNVLESFKENEEKSKV